jgi:IrrE N-terminal-like domain
MTGGYFASNSAMTAEIIDQLVGRLLAALGIEHAPPVDLGAVAGALGVNRIETAQMTEEGRLEQRAGQVSISLRAGASAPRRRFTLAHELGHLVLADPTRDFTAHRMWRQPDREERFCDEFAASLLMPRAWILAEFMGRPQNLATVRDLATATGASMSASVVRLRELLNWRCSLLYWRQTDDHWALLYCAGVPHNLHNRITSAPATREAVSFAAERRLNAMVSMPLMIGRELRAVPAEVSTRGAAVVALADFTRAVPVAPGPANE